MPIGASELEFELPGVADEVDRLLGGLNKSQLQAVTAKAGPLVVMAGAGSGKTRVLTRRIAYRIITGETDPGRVMALTFTRAAANELRIRLSRLGLRESIHAGTFHRLAMIQLRERWAERQVEPPRLIDNKTRFVSRLLGPRSNVNRRDLVAEIDWARARLVGPEHYGSAASEAGRKPPVSPTTMADILRRYQEAKKKKRVIDFDDLLLLAIRDLRGDVGYAEAIRWRYRHLYVDEFQDVNPLQFELLSEWRGGREDLFVVGDPNQAIYGWNGADPTLLARFAAREPTSTTIRLDDNYRSTPQILALAATMAESSMVANCGDGPAPEIHAHADDDGEARAIAKRAIEAHSGAGRWGDQAVLVRTNAQLAIIDSALREARVPTKLRSGSGPLSTPEVKRALERFTRPDASLPSELELLDDSLQTAREDENTTPADIERQANVAALSRLIHDYLNQDPTATPEGLADWIATLQATDVDVDTDAVELTTFHGAKGLEWPVVHIAGLEDGYVPIAYAKTAAQKAEERRLLYVAITRAEEELHLSWAANRTFADNTMARQASPFLAGLADSIQNQIPGQSRHVRAEVDWRAGLAEARSQIEASTDAPVVRLESPSNRAFIETAYKELWKWRNQKARAARANPRAMFDEDLLRRVAEAMPTTAAELVAVEGLSTIKIIRYGKEILERVNGIRSEHTD